LLAWGKSDFKNIDWEDENDGRRYDAHRTWKGNTHPWRDKLPAVAAQYTQRPVNRDKIRSLSQPLRTTGKPPVLAQFINRPVNYERLYEIAEPKPVVAYQDPDVPARHTYFPSKKYMKWLETSAETREPFSGKTHSKPGEQVRKHMSNKFGSVLLGWEAMGGTYRTRIHKEAFIKALGAMEYPHDPVDGYNDLAPKTRDFVILSDLDVQAARALKENPEYAKKRERQKKKEKEEAEAEKPPEIGALGLFTAALAEKFPDVQTAWDEFLDPEGVGGLTKASLMHAVQALGLAGFVKGIPGDVRGFVRELMSGKKSTGEMLLLSDLPVGEIPHAPMHFNVEGRRSEGDPTSDPTSAKSEPGQSMHYGGTVDDYTIDDFATVPEGSNPASDALKDPLSSKEAEVVEEPQRPPSGGAGTISRQLAHEVIVKTIICAYPPDLGPA
jgi:hypothetical protein